MPPSRVKSKKDEPDEEGGGDDEECGTAKTACGGWLTSLFSDSGSSCFFEPTGENGENMWVFVGSGNGGYERVPQYDFVGDGKGDYELESDGSLGCLRIRQCCAAFIIAVLIGAIVYLVTSGEGDGTTTTRLPFDCSSPLFMTAEKRGFCCVRYNIFCTTTPYPVTEPPTSTPAPYDCRAGYMSWERGWSNAKKVYCCLHAQRACPTAPPPTPVTTTLQPRLVVRQAVPPIDCQTRPANWADVWTSSEKDWCCRSDGVGCAAPVPAPPPPPPPPYNCNFETSWQTSWHQGKRDYCCRHSETGCTKPFDCFVALDNWEASWSDDQKKWCCADEGKGCPEATPCCD